MFGGQAELTGRGEIEHRRLSPDFDQHRTEPCAAHRVEPSLKRGFLLPRMRDQQPRRINAQGSKTMRIEAPRPALPLVMTDPEERLAPFHGAPGKEQGESGGRCDIFRLPPDRFVQPSARQAAKARIHAIAAQSEAAGEGAAKVRPGRRGAT